ncbi:MAG TPA: hypothetical protein VMH02_03525 [Verrucomicrobiae bacterium]|nr:hypothetical protein [Verrucomicrobiae bacterium]
MRARTLWQLSIALAIAVALLLTISSLADLHDSGDFGFTATRSGGETRVSSVAPGSPAAKAGLQTGERIYTAQTLSARAIATAPRPGDRMTVRPERPDAAPVALVAVGAPPPPAGIMVVVVLTRLAFLAIAGLVAWRRRDDPAARALATFLAAYGTALSVDFDLFALPVLRFASFVLTESLYVGGTIAVLLFACRFPPPTPGDIRRRIARAVPAIGAIGFGLSWWHLFEAFFRGSNVPALLAAQIAWFAVVLFLALGLFVGSYRRAGGPERVRMLWMLGTFGVGFSGMILVLVADGAGLNNMQWIQYCALTLLLIPLGLGYAILRHRVLDIGFVVNRAVVYTGVSFVVVGAFIAFEWLLGQFVEQGSRTSLVLQLGAALVLGLSIRFIHNRVDRYVDDLFFRERHAAEAAVRRFALEAGLITSPDELVRKTVETAQSRMRLGACAFFGRRDGAYVPLHSTMAEAAATSENDYAILEMRAWHAAVNPHECASSLPGEIAFPMMVRGSLSGFLLCGPKVTHEAFAPDERDALGVLARDAGIALDSLRVRIVERELAYLAGDGSLPDDLRARLRALQERTALE